MYQIKRWYLMITGKSVWHVNQDIGKCFSKDSIRGYYNNMIEKVTKMPDLLESDDLPKFSYKNGEYTYFPVAIFQYGLGAYDLYLQTSDERYEKKFMQVVTWAIEHQDDKGRWNNFSHYCPEAPYGAMAQGEGVSLLVRAYKHKGNPNYLIAAKKAVDFMLQPLENGGTTKYEDGRAYLMEYTFKGMVLNGAIFSWWGLFDYVLASGDSDNYNCIKQQLLESLINVLPKFKGKIWSMYSLDGLIASPFYHNLHIAQMQAMYELTGEKVFDEYAKRWEKQQKTPIFKILAFFIKTIQKLME